MLVLASTAVTVIIVIAIVIVIGIVLAAFGPLTRREQERDDLGASMGPFGTGRLGQEQTREELGEDAGRFDPRAEERLDEENE